MASFFGEIQQVASRTVDDDDDEGDLLETSQAREPKFEVSLPADCNAKAKLIIVADGRHAANFFSTSFEEAKNPNSVGHVSLMDDNLDEENVMGLRNKKLQPSKIISLRNDTLLVVTSPDISPQETYFFTSEILNLLHPDGSVLIFTSSPLAYYRSDDHSSSLESPLVRFLTTTAFGTHPLPQLEQPNVVSGVPAAILSRCEVRDIPAALCVIYSEFSDFEDSVGELYSKVLNRFEASKHMQIIKKFSKINRPFNDTGNLYM